uniref:NADH dehydrogenase subunit 2 n=1 Tax=Allodia zaitzevi TaxID=1601812 RepID=UPI001EE04C9A|nr:NADH dehydrogenase subunit 2 [Allodia zaitzevi]UIP57070.1 NADH dehydrogenase subunit 2 [Allodia zaitzevi]
MFLFSMVLGTFITISSNSWMGVWMGLEINLLSFIPLMIDLNNLMSTEASLKYFLTQAFASSLLLFSMILFMVFSNFSFSFDLMNFSFLMSVPLMIKSGMAPFHFWFPSVLEGISWMSSLMLMTWQKIAPLIILSYLMKFNFFIMIIILSAIVGAIGGLNQTSLRKILAFSSINHLGWMLAAMIFNEYLWSIYFLIYSFISIGLVFLFYQFNLFHINQIFSTYSNSATLKFSFLVSFLSLAGLPPFLGFLPKWLVIQSLTMINQYFLTMILICMSLVTMYFYLRICYSTLMLNYTETSWSFNMNFKKNSFLINMMFLLMSIFGLFLMITLIYFY